MPSVGWAWGCASARWRCELRPAPLRARFRFRVLGSLASALALFVLDTSFTDATLYSADSTDVAWLFAHTKRAGPLPEVAQRSNDLRPWCPKRKSLHTLLPTAPNLLHAPHDGNPRTSMWVRDATVAEYAAASVEGSRPGFALGRPVDCGPSAAPERMRRLGRRGRRGVLAMFRAPSSRAMCRARRRRAPCGSRVLARACLLARACSRVLAHACVLTRWWCRSWRVPR